MKNLPKLIYFLILTIGLTVSVLASGPNFNDTTLKALTPNASGNVGIGTTLSANGLDVATTAAIGASYAGYMSAAANGLIVQGNVGIGSAAPGKALDVQGTIRMTGFTMSSGASSGNILTTDANGNGTWAAATGVSSQWTAINTHDVYLPSPGNVGIGTSKTTTAALDILNGNVGIGTWKPAQSLDIAGSVRVTSTGTNYFSGDIGIGTTAPTQSLIVNGTVNMTAGIIQYLQNLTTNGWLKSDANGNLSVDTTSYLTSDMWTASGSDIYEANNVGVGVSPNYAFDMEESVINGSSSILSARINNTAGAMSQLIIGDESQEGGGNGSAYLQIFVLNNTASLYPSTDPYAFANFPSYTINILTNSEHNSSALNLYATGGNGGIAFYTSNSTSVPAFYTDSGGNVTITGTLIAPTLSAGAGSDPPYELYFDESRAEVLNLVRNNVPAMRKNGLVYFYNKNEDEIEYLKPSNCTFYVEAPNMTTGEVYLKEIDKINDGKPCFNTNVAIKYGWDKYKGQVDKYELPIPNQVPEPEDKMLDRGTGNWTNKPHLGPGKKKAKSSIPMPKNEF